MPDPALSAPPPGPPPGRAGVARRVFIRDTALVGAGAAFLSGIAGALPAVTGMETATAAATPVAGPYCFDQVTYDTMAGICAFVVPGTDEFSRQQRLVTPGKPGGVAAGAPATLALVLNQVLLDPTMLTKLVEALETLLGPLTIDLPATSCPDIGSGIPQSGTVPLAPLVAAVLNLFAVTVAPLSALGPFTSPFARLRWADKAAVWKKFEVDLPELLLPPPAALETPVVDEAAQVAESLGGLLDYAGGAVLELVGLLTYTEGLAYDRDADRLTDRPIGWAITRYQPGGGPVDGWPEFRGYLGGRRSVDA